eukprot:CAMPEP_0170321620 /NCGR_PEP_ID=MMETSP0116_2-20130129/61576_1 /TAXON_ID=400756 /ORGANISM="Durinskia baltica, Strain CSIRO CS-38" /LENGTH=133 /DNA_ID=CAMNT_0010574455 /DNA_START=140 /DNA_END=538 /DNA_ORIENTATION=+
MSFATVATLRGCEIRLVESARSTISGMPSSLGICDEASSATSSKKLTAGVPATPGLGRQLQSSRDNSKALTSTSPPSALPSSVDGSLADNKPVKDPESQAVDAGDMSSSWLAPLAAFNSPRSSLCNSAPTASA